MERILLLEDDKSLVTGMCSGACGARPGEAIAGNARHSSHQRTLTNKKQAPERSLFAGMLRRFWV